MTPSPNKIIEALSIVCSTDEDRPRIHAPFRQGRYVYATDGYIAMRIKDDPAIEVPETGFPAPDARGLFQDCREQFQLRGGVRIDIETVRKALETREPLDPKPTEAPPCPTCKGKKKVNTECENCGHEHYCICDDCEGEGIDLDWNEEDEEPPIRMQFQILDSHFSDLVIEKLVAFCDRIGADTVEIMPGEYRSPAAVIAGPFEGLIMPLAANDDTPVFVLAEPKPSEVE